ncbi:MAG: hypothetical protein DRJ42_30885 [Deltaproteobacteria bacterium]|nr:MAG: hypothetical protein DRJ42_30885 [Deltaproteobacteria bacterium]
MDGGADTMVSSDGSTPDAELDSGSPADTSPPPDSGPAPECRVPSDCDDGIACTDDSCRSPSNTCNNTPNDALCSPGMTCQAGIGCTGTACDESPCRLLTPQCGCPTGEGCYLTSATGRSCLPAGTLVEGAACASDGACEPGHICAGFGVAACLRACRTDAECPGTTNLCLLNASDGVTKACTGTCDPIAQTGCPPGGSCGIAREDTGARRGLAFCSGLGGPGVQGSGCSDEDDCAAGYTCGGVCAKICRVGLSDCPTGTTCDATAEDIVVGSTTYNFCG